ncbi:MAG: HEPN domain-containing protein [Chloroflexota bacterium]|nr:HEPN domain-containing protein [Chloroflexota bacterium]
MDNPKADLVRSWLKKAQRDLGSARRLGKEPDAYLDTAIYHCQQAAEKALKAFLVNHDIEFEKTHHLGTLLDLCTWVEPNFKRMSDAASNLAPYATAFRYPDEFFEEEPEKEEFNLALEQAGRFVAFVSGLLPKDVLP